MSSEKVSGDDQIIPAAINALMEQRATYQDWLDKLDRKRGNASPDVYRKVLSDYRERLEEVEEELAGHRAELESTLDGHRDRVEKLEEERSERSAELEEAELRFAVGEYEEGEWDRLKADFLSVLNATSERLSAEQDAVRGLEEVLLELSEPARAARSERDFEDQAADADSVMEAGEAKTGEKDRKFLDELEFLESLSVDDAEELDSVSISLEGKKGESRD